MTDEIRRCWIPATIMGRTDLSTTQKILFGRILMINNQEGCCWANNKTLGKQIMKSSVQVSSLISDMVKKNLLIVEVMRDEETSEVVGRKIYPINYEYNKINEVEYEL